MLTASAAIGVDAKDGSLLWRYEKVANRVANIATPVYADGHVFYSSDYNTGCALLKLTAEGGKVTATEVYFSRDMQNHYTTSIKVGDYLYGFSGNQPGVLVAMEFKTGKVAWKDRSVDKGNCIFAENLLYCQGENGKIGLIGPSPAGYKEISRFAVPAESGQFWAPAGICGRCRRLPTAGCIFANRTTSTLTTSSVEHVQAARHFAGEQPRRLSGRGRLRPQLRQISTRAE